MKLPTIDIKSGSMFFYPFRLRVDGVLFDYILAQPLVRHEAEEYIRLYFSECDGVTPAVCIDGTVRTLAADHVTFAAQGETKRIEVMVLSDAQARRFHWVHGAPVFADGTLYRDGDTVYCETTGGCLESGTRRVCATETDVAQELSFAPRRPVSLPHGYYLYSLGKRAYYELTVPPRLLEEAGDLRLTFAFDGLNLQVFSGKTLVNDYFNTDGVFVMYLREFASYLRNNPTLLIKTAAPAPFGAGKVYNEIGLRPGNTSLRLTGAKVVHRLELSLREAALPKTSLG